MHIRLAEERDLLPTLTIYNYEVEHGVATLDLTPKTPAEWQIWMDEHNQNNHPLLVAEVAGEVAGYASLSPYRTKEAYRSTVELSVYIAPTHRRQGVATALMEEILKLATADPITHNVVSVITAGNEASIRLHRRFGFTYCGRITEVGVKFDRMLDIDNYQKLV